MLRCAKPFVAAAILAAFFVCDVDAQSPSLHSRFAVDTAYFDGDTVVLHTRAARTRLAADLTRFIEGMRPLPGLPARSSGRIDVYLAANEQEFTALTGGVAPHWGAGIAQPETGVIVIPAYASPRGAVQNLGGVLRHEIAHVQLHRSLTPARIPRWFTEGYAVWSAGQLDADGDWYLRVAFVTGRAPPLDSLALAWPLREEDARAAYLLSASAVGYLRRQGDDRAFSMFLQRWQQSMSMESALRSTYYVSSAQFEVLWQRYVKKHYGWLLFSVQGVVASSLVGVIAIAMVFARRRRDRRRMEELRRNEGPDAPAYWLESWVDPTDTALDSPDSPSAESDSPRAPNPREDSG